MSGLQDQMDRRPDSQNIRSLSAVGSSLGQHKCEKTEGQGALVFA